MKVLLLEDDRIAGEHIFRGLSELGHFVRWVQGGGAALDEFDVHSFDIAILDRMVPGTDGLEVVRTLRSRGGTTPVLMLTAMGGLEDRVAGLDGGADDYLAKPFAWVELIARINALVRRPQGAQQPSVLRAQDIEMNLLRRELRRGGRPIDLQPREFRLLEQLLRNADRVVTKTMLLQTVWDFDFDPKTNVVETQVSRLRSKLNEGFASDPIQTVRGAGYMIRSDD